MKQFQEGNLLAATEQIIFILVNAVLIYGNLLYQFTRLVSSKGELNTAEPIGRNWKAFLTKEPRP